MCFSIQTPLFRTLLRLFSKISIGPISQSVLHSPFINQNFFTKKNGECSNNLCQSKLVCFSFQTILFITLTGLASKMSIDPISQCVLHSPFVNQNFFMEKNQEFSNNFCQSKLECFSLQSILFMTLIGLASNISMDLLSQSVLHHRIIFSGRLWGW